jgi:hypothetical protein
MNYRTLFLITIIFLLLTLFFSNNLRSNTTGKVQDIQYSNNRVIILLEEDKNNYILFTKEVLDLKIGEKVVLIGKKSTYKKEKQIIVDIIKKIN